MSTIDDLVDEVTAKIMRTVNRLAPSVQYGVFVSAEPDNTNLSYITIDGRPYHNVTKAVSVTGLVAGNNCIIISGGAVPLTIIAQL